ncbi:MAG: nicotinate-nucleotide--dimethylbenzimidazole phosphoribosyltransferase [Bacteroidota bacterium]
MTKLAATLAQIGDLDRRAMVEAQARLDSLTKPLGSLGVLETTAVRLAGVTGQTLVHLGDKAVIVMAGDHGVVEEGVAAYPQAVTMQMLANFTRGGAGVNVLARLAGARVVVADLGTAGDADAEGIIKRKIRYGTGNIARGPAMSREEAVAAIEAGIEIAQAEMAKNTAGTCLLATGEMGIGNTTPSSAILAAFSGFPARALAGAGTGLTGEGISRKAEIVQRALAVNKPDPRDGLDVLAKVGGLEIAGLAGVILAAGAARVPVLIDGFISTAAALVAGKIEPRVLNFVFASHLSTEPGHRIMLEMMGLKPMLHMEMRLGEGTGAVLAMHLVEAATRIMREMATFTEAGVFGPETGAV